MGEDGDEKPKSKLDMKDVANGPISEANRECRDIFCCLLFLIGIGAMVALSVYGYTTGNPTKIFRGVDALGNVCGLPGGAAEAFPYIYFLNPILDVTKRSCVAACPSFTGTTLSALSCFGPACVYTVQYNNAGVPSPAAPTSSTDILGYEGTPILGRVCLPQAYMFTVVASFSTAFSTLLQQGGLNSFISDAKNNYQWLIASVGLAIFVSFFFMCFLRCCAGCVVWLALLGTVLFLAGVGVLFLYNGGTISFAAIGSVITYLGIPTTSSVGYNNVIGWVFIGLAGLALIIVLCCCSRIRLAVAVCKCAGDFVTSVCSTLFVPIFQTLFVVTLWAPALVVMVYLVSGTEFSATAGDYFTSVATYGSTNLIMFYVFIFLTLWVNAYLQAMGLFVIASACCQWYYSHGPDQELSLPVLRGYKMSFRYHFGSLAFGALLLAIIQFIQLALELFNRQANASGAGDSPCFKYAMNCLRCCLECVERIIQFINKTAYIQIALRGSNFCTAAKDGFELVWGNPLRFGVVATVGGVLMFLGKIAIACLTAGGFYLFITFVPSVQASYLAPIYSIILVFIFGYAIGIFFMAVYSIAMDSLLQCFIVDEMNQSDGGKGKPLYAPQQLADLLP